MDDLVLIATMTSGRSFVIFIAPPGSALDSSSVNGGPGLVGGLVALFSLAFAGRRAMSHRWRVVVQERQSSGSLGAVLARRSSSSEADARRIATVLQAQIASGELPRYD
jgi:hypothetical protein